MRVDIIVLIKRLSKLYREACNKIPSPEKRYKLEEMCERDQEHFSIIEFLIDNEHERKCEKQCKLCAEKDNTIKAMESQVQSMQNLQEVYINQIIGLQKMSMKKR